MYSFAFYIDVFFDDTRAQLYSRPFASFLALTLVFRPILPMPIFTRYMMMIDATQCPSTAIDFTAPPAKSAAGAAARR